MIGSPSDADAVEGHEHHSRNPSSKAANGSPSEALARPPFYQFPSESEQQFNETLDRLARLGLHRGPSFPPSSLYISSENERPYLPFDRRNMSTLSQPVFDDHQDSDYDDLSSSRSSVAYSPRFEPSLPSLVGREATANSTDPDLLSLSGDTVSNADTVSDQFDGSDPAESFDYIRHEDIPDELRAGSPDCEEMDDGIMMSEHTIVPPTPTISQRLPRVEPLSSSESYPTYTICGLTKADEPYTMTNRPLHFLFVAAKDMREEHQRDIIAKIMAALTNKEHALMLLQPITQGYRVSDTLDTAKSTTVCVDHAVAFSVEEGLATLKNNSVYNISGGPLPDFAIFFHVPFEFQDHAELRQRLFPHCKQGGQFARALSQHGVPTLEMSSVRDQTRWLSSVMTSTNQAEEAFLFLHVRKTLQLGGDGSPTRISPKPAPLPLDTFLGLDNGDLTRHLAWIAKQKGEDGPQNHSLSKKKTFRNFVSTMDSATLMSIWRPIFFLVVVAAYVVFGMKPGMANRDIPSEMAIRQAALSLALNKNNMCSVNVTSVLHYPITTGVSSGTTTTGVAFPTAASVHVARPEQLFIALPSTYRSSAYLGLFRNGKSIDTFNVTKLIDGVYAMNLKPSDAHGQIQVNVRSISNPSVNETIKVDLGRRLLQRSTYGNAARDVQQNIQRDVEEVQTVAKAISAILVNNTHSALNVSVHRAKVVRNSIFGTAQQLSLGVCAMVNTTSSLLQSTGTFLADAHLRNMQIVHGGASFAKNATSAVGSTLVKTMPGKQDFKRARYNSLKLRQKLVHKPVTPVQPNATSVIGYVKQYAADAGHWPQALVSGVLNALGSKPGAVNDLVSTEALGALTSPDTQRKCSKTGLSCQKKCSKNMKGDITCHKCKCNNKAETSPKGEVVDTKQVKDRK